MINRWGVASLSESFELLQEIGNLFIVLCVSASLYTGKQRFKRSGAHDDFEGEGDEAEKKRLDDFANWLMTEGE